MLLFSSGWWGREQSAVLRDYSQIKGVCRSRIFIGPWDARPLTCRASDQPVELDSWVQSSSEMPDGEEKCKSAWPIVFLSATWHPSLITCSKNLDVYSAWSQSHCAQAHKPQSYSMFLCTSHVMCSYTSLDQYAEGNLSSCTQRLLVRPQHRLVFLGGQQNCISDLQSSAQPIS